MNVFLGTTALSEFWDTNAHLVFLGSRCLRPERSAEWAHLSYDVIPSPWVDRERFERGARYLDVCGERLLGQLGDYLNGVHGRSCSRRYWRVVLGNWLLNYLHATYDRYVHMVDALTRFPDLRTIVLDSSCFRVPNDTVEMVLALKNDDRCNLQLVSLLLTAMGYTFETRRPRDGDSPERPRQDGALLKVRRRALRIARQASRSLRGRTPDAVLDNLETMDHAAGWRLALASGFRVVPLGPRTSEPPTPAILDDRRSHLGSLDAEDGFERAAVRCLPYYLPTVFLEGYEAARQRTLAEWRDTPRVIVSTTGWSYDERFKLFAAEAADAGSRLVAVQHGGGYGVAREWPSEMFERRLSDTFVTWGWADGPGTGLRGLPNPKLSRFCVSRRRRHRSGATGLFVTTGNKQYVTRFNSSPLGILDEEYFDGHVRFLATLTDDVRRLIRLRPLPGFAHPLRPVIRARYRDVEWDEGRTLYDSLADARFVIVDHPVTSMLETLGADIPTILFWNPQHWEMRPAAEPYFEALRAAGVLHDSPEAAAAHVSSVADDVEAWWQGAAVQQACRSFKGRFALTAPDWATAWSTYIRGEIDRGQSRGDLAVIPK